MQNESNMLAAGAFRSHRRADKGRSNVWELALNSSVTLSPLQYRPVALMHIDDPTLNELLKVAVLEAPPHEVMPLVPDAIENASPDK